MMQDDSIEAAEAEIAKQHLHEKPAETTKTDDPHEPQHQASTEQAASQKQQAPQEQAARQSEAPDQEKAAKVEASSQPAKSATPAAPALGETHLEHQITPEMAPATDAMAEHATKTGGPLEPQHQASTEQAASQKQQAPQEQAARQSEAPDQEKAAKVEASSQPAKSATPAAPASGETHLEHQITPEVAPATDAMAEHATKTGGPLEPQHQASTEQAASQKQQAPQEQAARQSEAPDQEKAAKVEASSQPAKSATPAAPASGETHLEHQITPEVAPATDAMAEHATKTGGPLEPQHQASTEQAASQKQQAPQEQAARQSEAPDQEKAAKVEASSQPAKSATPAAPALGETHLEHQITPEMAPATDAMAEHATKTGGPLEPQHQASTEQAASQKQQAPQEQAARQSEAPDQEKAAKVEASSQPAQSTTPAAPALGETHLEHHITPEAALAADAMAERATKTGGPLEPQHQASTEQAASQKQQAPQEQAARQSEAPDQEKAAKVEASSQPAKSATPAAPALGETHLEHQITPEMAPATDAMAEHATKTGGPLEPQHQASTEQAASQKQQAPQEQAARQSEAPDQQKAAKVEASSQPAQSTTPAAPALGETHLEHHITPEAALATDAMAKHATKTGGPLEPQHQASTEQAASQKQQAPQEQAARQSEAPDQQKAAKVEASSQPAQSTTPAAPALGETHLEHHITPEAALATDAMAKHATKTGGPLEPQHQASTKQAASQKQQAPESKRKEARLSFIQEYQQQQAGPSAVSKRAWSTASHGSTVSISSSSSSDVKVEVKDELVSQCLFQRNEESARHPAPCHGT